MANKKAVNNFIINLVIYPFDIMISIGESDEEFNKAVTKHMATDFLEDIKGERILSLSKITNANTSHLYSSGNTFIRFAKPIVTAEQKGYVAHEVFHAVHFIFDNIGMPLTIQSCEAYAYMIDYVTTEIYKRM